MHCLDLDAMPVANYHEALIRGSRVAVLFTNIYLYKSCSLSLNRHHLTELGELFNFTFWLKSSKKMVLSNWVLTVYFKS